MLVAIKECSDLGLGVAEVFLERAMSADVAELLWSENVAGLAQHLVFTAKTSTMVIPKQCNDIWRRSS